MEADVRRNIDRGVQVETFWNTHSITNPDLGPLLTQLTGLLARGRDLAAAQRANLAERSAASARKRELERKIRAVHVPHLSQAGVLAVVDDPELGTITFRLAPNSGSFAAFRDSVGTMAATAEQHRDALIKRGMGASVLSDLGESIKEFDLAVDRGNKARAAHVEATAQLAVVASGITKVVRMMDAIARIAFDGDPGLLATWKIVSRRHASPQGDTGAPGSPEQRSAAAGDVRPAA
jgi:hypothetical protein